MHRRPDGSVSGIGRRDFLKWTGAAAGLTLAGAAPLRAAEPERVLRIVHLTDVHVQPELKAGEGMAACLRHIQQLQDKPGLILTGGDHVMDSFAQSRERTRLQWDLWHRVLKEENDIPVKSCIGNHDIWGWHKDSGATGTEPDYGKNWAVEALALPNRYYAFEQAGWKFIALDGVQPGRQPGSYSAYLDEEQLAWLRNELSTTPRSRPVLIWSHVPIASVMPTIRARQEPTSDLTVGAGILHTDAELLVNLLAEHSNVKVCLSGHLHQVDHCAIKGVNYHCNGAVSGAWWKGAHRGFPEGYALVDLYSDGSYRCEYVTYGWRAVSA